VTALNVIPITCSSELRPPCLHKITNSKDNQLEKTLLKAIEKKVLFDIPCVLGLL